MVGGARSEQVALCYKVWMLIKPVGWEEKSDFMPQRAVEGNKFH